MNFPAHASTGDSAGWWYRCCHWLCVKLYFDRVSVRGVEHLPEGGPVLYLGLHRNGAVDGFVYHQLAPKGVFLVSTQLRKSLLGRLFFGGIEVAREKDDAAAGGNVAALHACTDLLERGGELIIFPEGTSSLGPRHLPFKSGAARVAVAALRLGVRLRIVPLGIHYERAWGFRSRVEVVVGESVATDFSAGLSEHEKLKELKRRINHALEDVGVNFASASAQEMAERLAFAATLGTGRGYFESLKALEPGLPPLLSEGLANFSESRLLGFQGVPLFPGKPWISYFLFLSALGPPTVAGALFNLPPLVLAWTAARRLADENNVISLWRILVGVPLGVLWAGVMLVLMGWFSGAVGIAVYLFFTFVALKCFRRAMKLSVAVWNGAFRRGVQGPAWRFHAEIIKQLSHK